MHLWREREIKAVANVTGADIASFLPLAAEVLILPTVQTYPFANANRAILDLKRGRIHGAKVLLVASSTEVRS